MAKTDFAFLNFKTDHALAAVSRKKCVESDVLYAEASSSDNRVDILERNNGANVLIRLSMFSIKTK